MDMGRVLSSRGGYLMFNNFGLIKLKKNLSSQELEILRSEVDRRKKSTGVAYALWFFLSFLGIHKFYLGKIFQGFLYILGPFLALVTMVMGLTLLGGVTEELQMGGLVFSSVGIFGLVFFGIWWLLDLFTLHRQVENVNLIIEKDILTKIQRTNK
jgi:TM2 domain-containing membrane protein YozV